MRLGDRSRMSREVHVRFWESARVRFPRATHLPPDLRALTVSGIRQMAAVQLEFNKGAEARQSATFLKAGGKIYVPNEADMASFRAVKEPMKKWYVDQFGAQWYDKFAGAAADCEKSVDAELARLGGK